MLEGYAKSGDVLNVQREQRRLHVVAIRAASAITPTLTAVADFKYSNEIDTKTAFFEVVASAMDETVADIARLAHQFDDTFPYPL